MKALLDKREGTSLGEGRKGEWSHEHQVAWEELMKLAAAPAKPKKVVIIDDEAKIRVLFSRALEKAGYETVTFGDNASAIEYLNDPKHAIDLLILDLNMPRIQGGYFHDVLKIRHPSAKILIASNYGLDLQRFMILDADGYYDKSEGIKALKEKIKQALFSSSEF